MPCSYMGRTFTLSFLPDPDIPLPPVPESVRLVDGPGRCKGRVEIQYQGKWNTVCKTGWNLKSAKVVCRQLGCGRAINTQKSCDKSTQGKGPIWQSQIACLGQEVVLQDCHSGPWEKNNCTHAEDTWVDCEGNVYISRDNVHSHIYLQGVPFKQHYSELLIRHRTVASLFNCASH